MLSICMLYRTRRHANQLGRDAVATRANWSQMTSSATSEVPDAALLETLQCDRIHLDLSRLKSSP